MANCNGFVTTTPVDFLLEEPLSFNTRFQNLPGLMGLTFQTSKTYSGFLVDGQASLSSLIFQNLVTLPATADFSVQENSALTAISLPSLTSSSAATLLVANNPLLASFNIPNLTTAKGLIFSANGLVSFSAPALVSVLAGWSINNSPALGSINLPLLSSVVGSLSVGSNAALTSVNLSSLVSVSLTLLFGSNVSLSTVTFPNYLPTNGRNQIFSNCALTQASVDHVLARCVANAAYVSGTVTLNGGTNSTPSAAGLANKAILVARGVVVTNN